MIVAVADTHAVIWYFEANKRLSSHAKAFIEQAEQNGDVIAVSTITLVEIVYLIEKGRIPPQHFSDLAALLSTTDSIFLEQPIDLNIVRSLTRVDVAQIPEMSDRIIAATALHLNVPVISKDNKINLSSIQTIW